MQTSLPQMSRDPKNVILNESYLKAHLLLWTCMMTVAAALLWCSYTYLDEITRSDFATVVPSGQSKVIQSL
ncbi:hypothetical protein EBS02_08560, partial [bacterium]|nr:hypothetical protein [bacterium]